MMSPLLDPVLLHLGPVPLARSVLTSFGLTAILGGLAYLVQRRLTVQPGRVQALVELLVTTLQDQMTRRGSPVPMDCTVTPTVLGFSTGSTKDSRAWVSRKCFSTIRVGFGRDRPEAPVCTIRKPTWRLPKLSRQSWRTPKATP